MKRVDFVGEEFFAGLRVGGRWMDICKGWDRWFPNNRWIFFPF